MYSGLSGEVSLKKVTMFGRTSWSAKLEKAKLEISKHTHKEVEAMVRSTSGWSGFFRCKMSKCTVKSVLSSTSSMQFPHHSEHTSSEIASRCWGRGKRLLLYARAMLLH